MIPILAQSDCWLLLLFAFVLNALSSLAAAAISTPMLFFSSLLCFGQRLLQKYLCSVSISLLSSMFDLYPKCPFCVSHFLWQTLLMHSCPSFPACTLFHSCFPPPHLLPIFKCLNSISGEEGRSVKPLFLLLSFPGSLRVLDCWASLFLCGFGVCLQELSLLDSQTFLQPHVV